MSSGRRMSWSPNPDKSLPVRDIGTLLQSFLQEQAREEPDQQHHEAESLTVAGSSPFEPASVACACAMATMISERFSASHFDGVSTVIALDHIGIDGAT
jgi:hypothetical protein